MREIKVKQKPMVSCGEALFPRDFCMLRRKRAKKAENKQQDKEHLNMLNEATKHKPS